MEAMNRALPDGQESPARKPRQRPFETDGMVTAVQIGVKQFYPSSVRNSYSFSITTTPPAPPKPVLIISYHTCHEEQHSGFRDTPQKNSFLTGPCLK